ncbi:MAG: LamG domain-containing protein [Verrucomicrobia bacterium]|nr:LamG domain-containing protein [Verrucomicrobiota bacterium]
MRTRIQFKLLALCLCLFASNLAALRADCITAPSGLIAWWRGENNALDQVGANHGVMINGATFAPGKVGAAFLFDGVNDSMSIANSPAFSNLPQISFSVWFKFNALPTNKWEMIITKGRVTGPNSNCFWLFRAADDDRLQAGVETAAGLSGVSTSQAFNDTNSFHLAIVTYDGAQVIFYLDGTPISTNFTTGNVRTDFDPILIGQRNGPGVDGVGDVMNGLVDEAAVFNRALTFQEAQALFDAGSAGMCVAPTLNIAPLPGAVRLTWTTNATGYLLETNSVLTLPAGWGVLASNYSILSTNFAVTNAIGGATRFYRLHKP